MSWYRSNDNRKVVVYIVYTWYMRISYFKNRGIKLKIKKSNSIFKLSCSKGIEVRSSERWARDMQLSV